MNNKGISIAINQVVILIIAIIIFGLGISLMFKIFSVSEYQLTGPDERIRLEIDRALSSGSIVEIPSSTKTVSAKDLAQFYLGIKNDPNIVNTNKFHVMIGFNKAISSTGRSICDDKCTKQMITQSLLIPDFKTSLTHSVSYSTLTIQENEVKTVGFGVIPNENDNYGGRGQYFYNVCVCNGTTCFDAVGNDIQECNANKFSVIVNQYGYVTFSVIVK